MYFDKNKPLNNKLKVLSLFDGMSCGHIALERAGFQVGTYYASEIDKWAMKVTNRNYPETIQLGDISAWREWDIDWEDIDVLFAGFPCQSWSVAGMGKGVDDPRGRLALVLSEIFEHMKQLNVKFKFLFENVKMKKGYVQFLNELFEVKPVLINSSLVSAQNRERLYWTNITPLAVLKDKGMLLKDIIEDGVVDRDKSYCIDANYFKGGNLKSYFDKGRRQLVFKDNKESADYRKLTVTECERLQTVPEGYTEGVSNTQRYKMLGNGWTVDVIAHILKHI